MTRRDTIRSLVRRWIPLALLLLVSAALLVRLTVRDGTVWSAALFYATPWPVLFISWPVLACWLGGKRAVVLWAGGGLAATLTGWSFRPVAPLVIAGEPIGLPVKVMFWNIGHPEVVPEPVHALLDLHQPDLFVLAESEKIPVEVRFAFTPRHPDYHLYRLFGGMLVAVRGTAKMGDTLGLMNKGAAQRMTIQLNGRDDPWEVIVADLSPLPLAPRTPQTERIRQLAGTGSRTLVIGDFNTPYDSTSFDVWRQAWHHGLSQAPDSPGAGTWPFGLSLLAIDHVWMSRDLIPVHALKGSHFPFDHSWQMITIQPHAIQANQP